MSVVDISVISATRLEVLGIGSGIGVLKWAREMSGGVYSISLCPFEVVDSAEFGVIEDEHLCRDSTGERLRISVGQTIDVPTNQTNTEEIQSLVIGIADSNVATFETTTEPTKKIRVLARMAGSTSLVMNSDESDQVCEIVVE